MAKPSKTLRWPLGKSVLRKLANKKYRREYGLYLLDGSAAIADAFAAGADIVGVVHDARAHEREQDTRLLERLRAAGVGMDEVPMDLLAGMSDLKTPPPLVAVVRAEEAPEPELPVRDGLVLALDRVGDPGNVGTLLRAAAFFGVREVWLSRGSAELHNPKVLRAAMSAHLHLRVCEDVDLPNVAAEAKRAGAAVFATVVERAEEPEAVVTGEDQPAVLILGSEAQGVLPTLEALADHRLAIERRGPVDSLNVAMAGTVMLDRLTKPKHSGDR